MKLIPHVHRERHLPIEQVVVLTPRRQTVRLLEALIALAQPVIRGTRVRMVAVVVTEVRRVVAVVLTEIVAATDPIATATAAAVVVVATVVAADQIVPTAVHEAAVAAATLVLLPVPVVATAGAAPLVDHPEVVDEAVPRV